MIPSFRTKVTGTWTGCRTHLQPSRNAEMSGTTQSILSPHLRRKHKHKAIFRTETSSWVASNQYQERVSDTHPPPTVDDIKSFTKYLYIVSASTSPNHTRKLGVKFCPVSSSIATSPPPFSCNSQKTRTALRTFFTH